MAAEKSSTLATVGKVLGIIVACGVIAAGLIGWLGTYVYATKTEVTALQTEHVKELGNAQLRDHKIETLTVKVDNMQSTVDRTDRNVEKLLLIRRLEPAPRPAMRPLPEPLHDPPSDIPDLDEVP